VNTIINHHISKESFLLACKICEQGNPAITYDSVGSSNKQIKNLIKLKAFTIGEKYWLEDEDGEYVDIVRSNNQAGYFDKNNQFVAISYDALCSYKLDFEWMIKAISNNLEITKLYPVETIIDNIFWRIGTIRLGTATPVFFARTISHKNNFENIYKALLNRNGISKGVILTTSVPPPLGYNLPGNHKIISLRDCLVHDSNNFHIDQNIIKAAIEIKTESLTRQEGFSNGYRSGYFNGVEYTFSKKQAAIIEALHKHGGKINKYELLAEANSDQYDLYRMFRDSKGNYHPAWDVLIKNDGKGNYWLKY
jgi:hypothetical protein